ncbi:hypothetical protein DUI87_24626 [Hirundo rustica rustica]|uniref:Uncharacterized protein n=1 Tax=Hirundo rustica rustica TaxID=333673 RepID=A0A3M0JFJ0_HIRRU|nr:hypothetical protein DUI87_24626 [Hirundo rustica rustica]
MRGRGGEKEGSSDTGKRMPSAELDGGWERKWRTRNRVVVPSEDRTARCVQPPCSRPRTWFGAKLVIATDVQEEKFQWGYG